MKRCVALVVLILMGVGCVNVDPDTGKTIPRGGQHNTFEVVKRRAEKLELGINRFAVMALLGSPAKSTDSGAVWTYLPERPAVLVPSRALRLEFENGILVKYGYRTIVLGKDL
jgi:outer membrane protein assembly factor BamE (lipoprotein component of BamABCDE complex)